ncbi:hypothetical protein CDL12_00822 [Handroanthus impetiginosus]|uniref:Putative plant transposon protein domain-containing protein n=1 Tax=Handroanthus impetiginosus TaxID=429701 RepID=A0A2G9I9K2_9LAMI|nr:hypothetical protein CDL12_00822 [Handroanthus impetiginosus]
MSGRHASKRRKAGEGPSAPSFDNHRFISQVAEDHHNTNILKRRFVKERGLAGHEEIMHQRHWEEFMAKPEARNKTMIREFYANVKFNSFNDHWVLVRGATITFSSSAINHLLGAPIVDEPNDFEAFIQHSPSLETISEVICAAPPEWILNVHNEPVGIPHLSLTNEVWDWLRFINARLYPSSYLSEVNKYRAVLLYAIIELSFSMPFSQSARGGMTCRPRELGLEDRLTHVEEDLHRLQLQDEIHMVDHQHLRLEQRQCFDVLYGHFQIPSDRRPQFAPDEPDAPGDAA